MVYMPLNENSLTRVRMCARALQYICPLKDIVILKNSKNFFKRPFKTCKINNITKLLSKKHVGRHVALHVMGSSTLLILRPELNLPE